VGCTVVRCFIGISDRKSAKSAWRCVSPKGGHDVPTEKLITRFPRILPNLNVALRELPHVWVFDNDDLSTPFRLVAMLEDGHPVEVRKPIPRWLRSLLPPK
jgi:predicted ABC-type ATPase